MKYEFVQVFASASRCPGASGRGIFVPQAGSGLLWMQMSTTEYKLHMSRHANFTIKLPLERARERERERERDSGRWICEWTQIHTPFLYTQVNNFSLYLLLICFW